ncbi:retrovirus-related pol polyprotein from transposon TNT 1-94 [Tanacetum coccineum]
MTGNRSKLKNFVEKFIGTVRFGNDHFGAIMGYGDYVIVTSISPKEICVVNGESRAINGKKYILVIVDDYSRFTWVKFLRSKDETPEFVINFLKQIQVGLNKTVRYIRTDNGTEFVNQVMSKYYEELLLVYTRKPIPISTRHNKTPYELVHDKKPDLTFLRVFGALCYPTNDSEDLGKFQAKADIGIFVGYAPSRKGYRIYNKRTRRLMEINLSRHIDEMHQDNGPVTHDFSHEPVPSATAVNAQVVPPGTSLSTTIAQDAPSTSASSSTSDMHHPVRHQGIAEEPTLEDSPITHDALHPSLETLLWRNCQLGPDLVFAVCMCARYQAKPTKKHFEAIKRVFRYLKGTINMGLWYPKDNAMSLTAYARCGYSCGNVKIPRKKYIRDPACIFWEVLSFLEIDWLAGHQRSKEALQYLQ